VIEEALFGEYTRGKSRMHKQMASHIFHESIEESRQRLLPWIQLPTFNHYTCFRLCQQSRVEIQDVLYERTPCPPHVSNQESVPPAWSGRTRFASSLAEYSYYITVYLRVNCASALGSSPKIKEFVNAHIPVLRYLDALEDPRDACLELPLPYTPLGKTHYDEDRNAIEIESQTVHQTRPYPLQVIRAEFPNAPWTFEEVLERKLERTVRNACLHVMAQCQEYHEKCAQTQQVRDALWFYHACFLDYLYNYRDEYETYMPVELYPFDNRAFTAYDLPSAFHVLTQIPLWGEQCAPGFPLGKFIQKSLPFAGARRTLISHTDKLIATNEAFWRVFSAIFYCMLTDMYPEHLSVAGSRCWDVNRLLRMKQIASEKHIMRKALTQNSARENDKGCFIVFTAFRMWIALMTDNQAHFRDQVIDWGAFTTQTVAMAHEIRKAADIFGNDVFAGARDVANQHKMKVYRYRKSALVDTLLEKMTDCLEKDIYKSIEFLKSQEHHHPALLRRIDTTLDASIKTNVMNALIRAPRQDWLTPRCLSIMHIPEYGGVRASSIQLVLDMMHVYYDSAKPKDFERILDEFHVPDFKVVCWYFHVVHLLNRIEFQALTFQQVVQIEGAMAERYTLFPGQQLPTHAYSVFFTLCCGKIKTLCGVNEYGHRDIAYDMERNVYVCAKSHKKQIIDDDDEDYESERKQARQHRKTFNHIPCNDNPVLCIPLRGFMLIYNKTDRYMHCPQCAAFHRFQWTGYHGANYACTECHGKRVICRTCTVCGLPANKTYGPIVDPLAPDKFQHLYFCGKHYKLAERAPTKEQLYSKRAK